MQGFTEPNMPVKISLKMPGNSFSEKAKMQRFCYIS